MVEPISMTDYLAQLMKDKEQLAAFPNVFIHLDRLLDEEINRIRVELFQLGTKDPMSLPEPVGQAMQMTEKLYVPVKDHPEFNFVGRILGPRGMTAKQLEQETGCKIMVRGKGSMRDKAKEEQMKGKPNWEHLNDELHVLITVEDTKNRAEIKLKRAVEEIKKLLVPSPEGEDELKKKQLMELAIINGTYRDGTKMQQKLNQILIPSPAPNGAAAAVGQNQATAAMFASLAASLAAANRSPPNAANPLGQPLIISPRIQQHSSAAAQQANAAATTATLTADPTTGLIYTHIPAAAFYQQNGAAAAAAAAAQSGAAAHHHQHPTAADIGLLDYQAAAAAAAAAGLDFSQAGPMKAQRFATVTGASVRAHPYARVALS